MNLLTLKLQLEALLPTWKWTLSPSPELGLLSSPKAFELAKQQGKSPNEVAKDLLIEIEQILLENKLELEAKLAGPYINIFPKDNFSDFLINNLNKNFEITANQKKLLLEYVSPNIAKPLHAGHLVNSLIGESLKQILSLKYENLETEIYWGDWGIQFGIILWAWQQIGTKKVELEINGQITSLSLADYEKNPIDTLVKVYVWGNQQKDLVEQFDQQIREQVLKLENGDEEAKQLWAKFSQDSKQVILFTLKQIGISDFNYQFGESYYQDKMAVLSIFMDEHNLWETEEKGRFIDLDAMSASWKNKHDSKLIEVNNGLKATNEPSKNIPFDKIASYGRCYLIQSKDGYTTYPFRDIAARWHWAETLQADIMITLTDHTQSHNFHQAFSIVSYLASLPVFRELSNLEVSQRLQLDNLVHIPYGFLKLPEGKMSTRKGNFVTFQDILDQIQVQAKTNLIERYPDLEILEVERRTKILSLAAIKWTILAKDIIKDTVLNIPQILTFEGNTGVYQLYTFARLNSILKKNNLDLNSIINFRMDKLEITEKNILNLVNQLPVILEEICLNYKPHLLAGYLFSLATMINKWYTQVSVSNEEDMERRQSLLFFCQYLAKHMQQTLNLLGIETLDNL